MRVIKFISTSRGTSGFLRGRYTSVKHKRTDEEDLHISSTRPGRQWLSYQDGGDLLILLTFEVSRSRGRGACAELLTARVMRLEESHSKQTPNLNKRGWSLHQIEPNGTS